MRTSYLAEGTALPLVLTPDTPSDGSLAALTAWIQAERGELERMLRDAGGVLFRGFALSTAEEFQQAIKAFQSDLLPYVEGQSQRSRVHGAVYTSTEYPAEHTVTLHNELSYVNSPPRHIYFFCAKPPGELGETPIVDCRRVLTKLAPGTRAAFEDRGILYVKNMHDEAASGFGKSWQGHFETEDVQTVEDYLKENGVRFQWLADGTLRTSQVRPAITRHPETEEDIWFNQATLWHISNLGPLRRSLERMLGEDGLPTNAYFENGDPIDEDHLQEVREVMWNEATFFPWQAGDLLFLDNHLAAHGRNKFSGERSILVGLS